MPRPGGNCSATVLRVEPRSRGHTIWLSGDLVPERRVEDEEQLADGDDERDLLGFVPLARTSMEGADGGHGDHVEDFETVPRLCEQTVAVPLRVCYDNKFKMAGGTMSEWALQDAKNRLSAVVNAALSGKPQTVIRRGTSAGVVVAVEDYKFNRLCQAEEDRVPNFRLIIPWPSLGVEFERMPLEAWPLDI